MGVWDTPPTPEELARAGKRPSVWDSPPTEEELRGAVVQAPVAQAPSRGSRIERLQAGVQDEEPTEDARLNTDFLNLLGNRLAGGLRPQALAFGSMLAERQAAEEAGQPKPEFFGELYRQHRDKNIEEQKAMRERAGGAGTVADILGTVPQMGLGPAGFAAASGVNALGESEADLTKGEVGPALVDTAFGVGEGYLFGKAGEWLGGKIARSPKATGQGLKNVAEENATAALGIKPSDVKTLEPEVQQQIGRHLLDTKTPKGERLINKIDRPRTIKPKVNEAAEVAGKSLGDIRGFVDAEVKARPELAPRTDKILADIDEQILAPLRKHNLQDSDELITEIGSRLEFLKKASEHGLPLSPAELRSYKEGVTTLGYGLEHSGGGLVTTKAGEFAYRMKQVERIIEKELEATAARVYASRGLDPKAYTKARGLAESLIKGRQLVDKPGNAAGGATALSLRVLGGGGIGGMLGAAADDQNRGRGALLGTIATLAGGRFLKNYGRPFVARSADTLSKLLLADKGLPGLVAKSVSAGAKFSGRVTEALIKAAAQGPGPFKDMVHQLYATNSEFRRAMDEVEE